MLGNGFEQIKKFRKRYGHAIRVFNFSVTFCHESRNAEGHRETMIATRINLSTAQISSPRDAQTIFELCDLRAHCPEVLRRRRDPIGFLYPQLSGVADFDPAFDLRP